MSQYRFTGPKDDAIAEDGDRGFVGINQRDTLNQLKAGEVRVSQNGRMDGHWKPRKATNLKGAALTSSGDPLKLPFVLDDSGTTPVLDDTSSSNIYGSCLFSDGNSSNLNSILIAMYTKVVKVDLTTYAATDIDIPSGENISSDCHMLQCFDKVVIMRPGQAPLEWDGKTGSSFIKSPCGAIVQPIVFDGPTVKAVISSGVATVTCTTQALNVLLQTGAYVDTGANDTMVFPAQDDSGIKFSNVTGFYVGCDIKVGSQAYKTISAYDGPTRTATFLSVNLTTPSNQHFIIDNGNGVHNLVVGDTIRIIDTHTIPGLNVGDEFVIASVPTAQKFTFFVNAVDHASFLLTFGQPQSLGAGFIANPGAPWGFYFQRRLWVPYWYKPSNTYLSPVYTDRGTRNEIVVSDILDNNTFDTIYAEFKIGGGTADFTVGFHGFYEDTLVVFNRNSIHKITGTRGSLTDATVREITGEIGCMARKSIVMHGNQMFFLSDSGVFGLEFVDLYNLRNGQRPISLLIQPYIDRINVKLASSAVACYFDNRYWLAVPFDSTAGANDAIGNNSILIYNFLNQGWESVDTYQNNNFNIIDFHVGINGTKSSLYVVTSNGGIHKLNDADSVNDFLSVDFKGSGATITPIDSVITTRGYDMKDMGRKRFTDVQIEMQSLSSDGNSSLDVSFATEDPDYASLVGNTQDFIGEALASSNNANVRARLGGVRGYNGSVTLKRKAGSPKVISVKVAGSLTNRSIISQH